MNENVRYQFVSCSLLYFPWINNPNTTVEAQHVFTHISNLQPYPATFASVSANIVLV